MIGKNTEKAIKAWLKLPEEDRTAWMDTATGKAFLYRYRYGAFNELMATYTPQQVINKRGPKRKAKKVRK